MLTKFGWRPHVVARMALPAYLGYLAGCAWAWLHLLAGHEARDVLRFLIEVAAGLPWALPLLAMPTILGQFDPQVSRGQGFFTIVHVLAVLGVAVNLVVLNQLCDWGRFLRARPFQVTS